ncbi:Ig-like domain-containing protein [Flavobacterium aestivum]|uniref:Ig-like domain-containing protein n=1 Tax=Flavobacterium aestivum TaxID=3003257 RepID=UPI00248212B7|nr:Ig-like domain-containing protein [Flavobacterium aestivum]
MTNFTFLRKIVLFIFLIFSASLLAQNVDLGIVKTVNNSTPTVGSNVVFTLTATNNTGNKDATSVKVNDLLPSGYTFVSSVPSVGTYVSGTGVWTIGNLNRNVTVTLTITATVKATGTYANTATISGGQTDNASGNDSSTVTPVPVAVGTDTDGDGVIDSVDLDDDNDGILDSVECSDCAVKFINGGFEVPDNNVSNPASWYLIDDTTSPATMGWQTTASDHLIEFWDSGFNGVPAAEGAQFVELNANEVSTLYQTFCLNGFSGTVNWSVKHRGRSGTDVATVNIGTNLASATVQATMSDGTASWGSYSGTYTITPGQTTLVIAFKSVSSVGGASYGNFLDDVSVTINEGCVDTDGDGVLNYLDLDSDGDGCSDANEYYGSNNADGNILGGDNGKYGSGSPAVNANGTVIAASYSGTYTNAVTVGSASAITTQPSNQTASATATASFTVVGSGGSGTRQYQWQLSTDGGTVWNNIAGATAATLNLSSITCSMNNYKYRVVITQSNYICANVVSNSATLTVPTPTVVITNPAAVCSPSTVDLTSAAITSGSTASLTYTYWTNAGATTAYSTPTTATAGTYYIKGTTAAGCFDIKAVTVTVTPINTIALSSAVGTDAQTKCINTAITNITYATTGATGATFSGLPTGVTGNWAANTVTISGTPSTTVGSPFTYTITLTGGCGTVTKTGTITVTPDNTITLSSAVGTDAQTKCINTAITNITYSTTGATGATFSGLPTGVTGNWAANTVTISGTPSTTVGSPFTYTITLTGGCGTVTKTGTITVTPDNTITLSSAVGTDAQTKCINTAITNITYSTTGATGATFSGLPTGVTGNWAANTVTISGTPSTTVGSPFTYTITLTGGCGTVTKTGTITVTPDNTIALSSAVGTDAQTKCINTAITNITYSTTGATGATFSGLPTGVTGNWAANTVTISGTPSTTVGSPFTYTITLTGGCGTVTKTGTITVTPDNTIALSSAVGTDAQTKCINTAITNITYSTTGATGATFSGLPTGVTGNWAANTVTISGTPSTTVGSPFTYTITLTGGCGTVTKTGTITVTPDNTIALSSAVGTDAQTKCINTAITNITYSTTGATGATFSGLPTGVSGNWAANTVTISGTPSTTVGSPFTYTITLTGGCGTVTKTGTITVTPDNTIALSSAVGTDAQTKCINTAITNITYSTTGATGATFSGLPTGVTGNWAANTVTISGTPSTTVGSPFTYTITLTGGCGTITKTGTITVTPDNTITLSSAVGTDAQTKCINTAITNITYSTTGATGATFSGLPTGVTGNWAANTVTISGTPSTTVGSPFTYTITLTGGCGTVTKTGTITVTPDNTITLSSAVGTDAQTKCINTAITNITYSTTGATGATFSGLPTGVTGNWAANTVTISGTPSTTVGSPFTYTITLTGGCGTVTKTGTITVTPDNTIALSSAVGTDAQTKCINTAITNITYSTTGATGATFSGLPTGVTGNWAANIVTISGTPSTTVGSPFTYTITLTGGCGTVTKTGTITVTPDNTITLSSAVGTDTQTKCINTALTNITYSTTGATGATFSGLPTGVTGNWAANTVTISGTPSTTVGSPFTYTITLTGGCGTVAKTGTITVTPDNTITLSSAVGTDAQTKCINTALTNITYSTTGATGATFSGLPTGVTGNWAANIVTISGTPSTTVGSPFTYTITLTGGCGTVTKTGTITVTPDNTITLSSAVGTDAQTKCINTALTNITYSTTGATGATFSGLPTGVTGNWAANTVTISGTPSTTVGSPFTYTITLTGGCGTVTKTGTITVTPDNTITLSSAVGTDTQTKCINTAITNITYSTTGATGATFSGLPTGVTGNWAANTVTISGTPSTTVGSPFTYTITLTGGCGTVTKTGTITVTPAIANNTISAAQTICMGTIPTALTGSTPTGGSGTYVYLWESSTTSAVAGFSTASGTSNTINYAPGSLTTTTWYRRTVTSGTCSDTSAAIQITVGDNIKPTFTAPANITIFTTASCTYDASVVATGDVTNEADNCSAGIQATYSDLVANGSCQGSHIITRTWSLVDGNGNAAADQVQTITVSDTTAPVWTTAATALNSTIQCSDAAAIAAAQGLAPVATDNCSTVAYTKTAGAFVAGACANSGTYTNTWVANDVCSNTSVAFTQVITIEDTTAPVWTTAATALNSTIQCSDAAAIAAAQGLAPVATDNCSTVAYTKTAGAFVAGACANSGTYTNTWVANDVCSNTSVVFTQVITIEDTTAPVWTTAATALNSTIQCSDAAAIAAAQGLAPVATDNCSTVAYTKTAGAFVAGACANSGTYTNTWVANDVCSNTSVVFTQVITIEDTTAPVWTTAATALNSTIQCSDAAAIAAAQGLAPVATDNCSTVAYTKTVGAFVAGACANSGTYTNTWVANDVCSNTSVVFTQVITIEDTTAPVWTTAATALNSTIQCSDAAAIAAAQGLAPVATDNCSTVAYTKTAGAFVAGACANSGTYTNTWVANDVCSNTSVVFTQVITIEDTTAPVWTTAATALNSTIQCSDAAAIAAAQGLAPVATDNCSTVAYTKTAGAFVAGACANSGTYTNTWVANDVCSNTSVVFTQVITIEDTTAPVWTTAATALNSTIQCSDAAAIAAAQGLAPVATDNCSTVAYTKTAGAFVAGACANSGTYTNTWVANDVCSNTSVVFTQVITIEDTTAPVWTTAATALNSTIQCSDAAAIAAAQGLAPVATDNCSTVAYTKTAGAFVAGACANSGTYTNTWVANDVCSNTSVVFTQVITIEDTTAPVWTTAATALNSTIQCSDAAAIAAAQGLAPVATDNCSTVAYTKTAGAFVAGACANSGTYTNTWVANDVCSNTSVVFTQVITIEDTTAPVWTTAATALNSTIQCSDAAAIAAAQGLAPVATDNCSTVAYTKTAGAFVAGACANSGTYTNTWVANDVCSNTSVVFTQVITIEDTTAPVWTTAATALNSTIQCSDAAAIAAAQGLAPVATDNCSTVAYTKTAGAFVAGACANSGTYTNTWVANDVCSNTSVVFTQVITIEDTTAPVWTTAATALNSTIQCSDAAAIAAAQGLAPVATDNCSTVAYTKTAGAFVAGACANSGTYTNTWVANDVCSNTSVAFTQVITIEDTTAPVWTTAATALNSTIQCSDAAAIAAAQGLAPVATDNCSTVAYTKTAGAFVAGACANSGTYTNTWVANDVCSNTSVVFTQVITIEDTTAPVWTTAATALNSTIQCSDAAAIAAAQGLAPVATDNCSTVAYTKTAGAFVAGACANSGTYTNTWVANDVCSNTSVVFTQVITIEDTTAPVWTTAATALNSTIQCSDAAAIAAAQGLAPVATDNCSTVAYTKTAGAFVAGACANSGTYTNTWVANDVCSNTSVVFTQVITIEDTTAPVWTTAATALNSTIQCSDAAAIAAAQGLAPVATDNCSTVAYTKTAGAFVAGACANSGTYTNTWVANDVCSNTSVVFTQVITIEDTTAPVWTTAATALNSTIQCSDAAAIAAAQGLAPVATDNCSTVAYTKTAGAFVAGACANSGTYTNTWVANDVCSNTSVAFTQVITIEDTTAPVWTTAATALNSTIQCSDAAAIAAAQGLAPVATDNCSTVAYTKTAGAFVAGACANSGTYTNTWVANDVCSNTSVVFTQVITIEDTTAPVWTTAATALNSTIQCSDAAAIAAAQGLAPVATDNCSTVAYTKTAGAFVAGACANSGTYTNTWVANDVCSNTSVVFTQVITIEDTTAPVWTTAATALNSTIQCSDAAAIAAAQGLAPVATDNCSTVAYTKTAGAFVAGACANSGTYTNTWVANDVCSNTSVVFTQVITIEDTTAPVWTTAATALNSTIQCSDAAAIAAAQGLAPVATDNCSTVAYTKTAGAFVAGACANSGTYTNTWVANDVCSNTSVVFTQVITIEDTTAPVWTTAATALNSTIQCSDAAAIAAAQGLAPVATDNCSTVAYTKTAGAFVAGACANSGTYTNTWVANDVCSNTSVVFTQVITIEDTTAPVWTTAATALNSTIQCSDAAAIAAAQGLAPVATDNCSTVAYTKTAGAFVAGACANSGTYTNTWVANDVCSNTSVVFTQVITIEDTTAPVWTTAATALNSTIQCSDAAAIAAAQGLAPVATDNCSTVAYTKTAGAFVAGACANSGTYTNTWVANDVCSNTSVAFTQVITIEDTTAPVWTTAATALNSTIQCSDAAAIAAAQGLAPVATDNCSTVAYTKTAGAFVAGACANSGTYTNTWVANDVCSNTSVAFTQVITIEDTTAPVWTTAATALNSTIQCSDAAAIAAAQGLAPVATDNCSTVAYTKTAGAFVAGACANSGTYTNTWVANDVCSNTSVVFTQVITIEDTTAPVWTTAATALNSTIQCSDAAAIAAAQGLAPVATDNCSTVAYTKTAGAFVAGACANSGTYTNTWVANDVCSNTSVVFTQVITIEDTTAPVWTTAATALNSTIQCSDAAAIAAAQGLAPVATDNCSTVAYTKTAGAFVAGACANSGTYTNTWVANDVCSNTSVVFTQVITIEDTTAPVWTTAATALNSTIQCSDAAAIAAAQGLAPVATDNCSTVAYTKTAGAFVAGACANSGTYTNTWVANDVCSNTSVVFTQVITIEDTTAPVWTTAATALNSTIQCSDAAAIAAAQGLAPVATDNCSTVAYTKTAGAFVAGACANSGTYTNTWVANDVCSNTSVVFTQVITIEDTTAPVWTTAATALNSTIQCSDAAAIAAAQGLAPVATDNCSTVAYTKTAGAFVAGACANSGTYTNTWVANDVCSNTSVVFTQVITIEDTTAPVWTTAATALNSTIQCSDAAAIATAQGLAPVATDNCSTVAYTKTAGAFVAGACANSGTYTNTWVANDVCSNTSVVFTQVITIEDTTAPVWTTAATALNSTIQCSDAAAIAAAQGLAPVATDNCSTVAYTKTAGAFVAGACANSGTYTNTWVANDVCSNTSVVFTQVITIEDTTAPVWTTAATALNSTIQCSDAAAIAAAQGLAPVATDNCSTVAYTKTAGAFVAGACANSGTYTNTWVANDVCSNTSVVFTQVITIEDTTAPVWTTAATALNSTIQCSDAAAIAAAQGLAPVATDNCSTVAYTKTAGAFVAGACANSGTYTNTWVANDVCSNTSVVFTQVITIEDTTAPVWTTAATALNSTIQCSDAAAIAAAQGLAPVATDNCSTVAYTKTAGAFVAGACANSGTYTNTWVANDVCSNTSVVFTQVITIEDTTAPVWTTAATALNSTIQCSDAAAIAAAQGLAPVATDNCSTVAYTKTAGAFVAGACANSGTYTNTWVANDVCSNTSVVFTQVITIEDTTAPVWTTAATALNSTIQCSDAAAIAAAQGLAPVATDNCSTVAYTKTAGAFVAGACANSGTYTNTWVANDVCSNTSVVFTQVITIEDTTAPVWTTAATALNSTIQCSDAAAIAAAQGLAPVATDNCSTVAYTKTAGAFVAGACANSGTYTNTWVANDVCSNTSVVFTQVITIEDTTAPVWTTAATALNSTIQCSDAAAIAAAQGLAPVATDNCSTVAYTKTAGAFVAGACANSGTYTNTWVANDVCSNTSVVFTQVITIEDTTAPVWTTAATALNSTIQCSDAAAIAAAQGLAPVATDNCSTVAYTKTAGAFVAGACANSGTYTNTWVANDVCSNTSVVFTQVITIEDTTAPVWTTAATALNSTIQCSDAAAIATAQGLAPVATDNCSTVAYTKTAGAFVAGACANSGTYTNTWVANDVCSNTSVVFTQVITIEDTTAPVLSGQGGTMTISSPVVPVFSAPTAIDACDSAPVITFTDVTVAISGGSEITRTWKATDACGNVSAPVSQVIKVLNASVVSIVATTANASEPSTNGLFTISLSNPVTTSTVVTYTVTGTATNGTDYATITNTITIPANTISVTIPVTVIDDNILEGSESVIITLNSTNNAVTVTPIVADATATVTINDNEITPTIGSIQANNDDAGTIDPIKGIKDVLNILANDTFNGQPINLADIILTVVPNTNFNVAPNGVLEALANIPGGVHTLSYTICEKANPNNCSSATVSVFVVQPSIALVKAGHLNDENGDSYAQAGETITYSFDVTNTGNTPLTDVNVSDPLPGVVMTGGLITLGVGESNTTNFKGTYVITQADVNLGSVSNQATVYGTSPNGRVVEDKSDDTNLVNDNPTVLNVSRCVIKVYNAVSPDGGGKNDKLYIEGLDCYPNNSVEVYNRWGVLVFEREHYNNDDRSFRGVSEGRVTVEKSQELPVGTYFYILKYKDNSSNTIEKSGYLYLNRR